MLKYLLPAALSLAVSGPALAATVAYDVPGGTAGNQSFTSVLGMTFDVNAPITVDSLGAFDSNSDGITVGTTLVTELWSQTAGVGDAVLASVSFTNSDPGTLTGGSLFKGITSLELAVGSYAIVSYGYNANDQNGNQFGIGAGAWTTNDGGGVISFTGGGQFGGTLGATIGDTLDGGPVNRYAAGTFTFESAVVPLPAALPLSLGAMALLGGASWRRRKQS